MTFSEPTLHRIEKPTLVTPPGQATKEEAADALAYIAEMVRAGHVLGFELKCDGDAFSSSLAFAKPAEFISIMLDVNTTDLDAELAALPR